MSIKIFLRANFSLHNSTIVIVVGSLSNFLSFPWRTFFVQNHCCHEYGSMHGSLVEALWIWIQAALFNNKTGKSKVGAISETQKAQFLKFPPVFQPPNENAIYFG